MTASSLLLPLVILAPLAMLALCPSRRISAALPALLPLAALPGLAAALFAEGASFDLPGLPLRFTLALDRPAAVLLGAASLLWALTGFTVKSAFPGLWPNRPFLTWWLLTMTGSLGVFIAADLTSFYLLFSIVSLAAYGLIAQGFEPKRAISVYIALAVLGEAFLLMAFVLLASTSHDGTFLIRDLVAALPASPWRDLTIACLVLGFGLKIGLVPGHVWMPLVYPAAPLPAASVLSGAAVKSGVIGLILFLPFGSALPAWGDALAVVGFASAFYGALVGLTQSDPRSILAYSSISQMGLVAALCGIGLATGYTGTPAVVAFYAAHHVLVKGSLFLALPVASAAGDTSFRRLLPAIGVIALALAGLPLTGGYIAKFAIKPMLDGGMTGFLGMASSFCSALLMSHFLGSLTRRRRGTSALPAGVAFAWWSLAAAATALPWLLLAPATGLAPSGALSVGALLDAALPVLGGCFAAALLVMLRIRLPAVPPGDVVTFARSLLPARQMVAGAIATCEALTRQWPVAGIALLLVALAIGAVLRLA